MTKNSQSISRLSKKFLTEVNKIIGDETNLDNLIEILESTNDPDPSELFLLDSLYKLKEKLVITKSKLDNYVKSKGSNSPSNKLHDLYFNSTSYGTSKLFDD